MTDLILGMTITEERWVYNSAMANNPLRKKYHKLCNMADKYNFYKMFIMLSDDEKQDLRNMWKLYKDRGFNCWWDTHEEPTIVEWVRADLDAHKLAYELAMGIKVVPFDPEIINQVMKLSITY